MKGGQRDLLEGTLGYRFKDAGLLSRAVTHGSVSNGGQAGTYERLEFLGDSVLGLAIADMLYERFADAPEGELSRRFHRLVSGGTCAEVAREMQLERFVRISGGQPTSSVLGDVCESLLGAVYRDGGLEAARALVERYWRSRLETTSGTLRDAKTELQEWAHRGGFQIPVYRETGRSGPDHALQFEIEVGVGDLPTERGRGRSKREAEHEAAALMLRREGVWGAA